MRPRGMAVAVLTEDEYGLHAVNTLLKREGIDLGGVRVRYLQACSGKFERVVEGFLKAGFKVVVVLDGEGGRIEDVVAGVVEKHPVLGDERVKLVVLDPCLEVIPCEGLGRRGCRSGSSCGEGPVRALNEYYRRVKGRDCEKRLVARAIE